MKVPERADYEPPKPLPMQCPSCNRDVTMEVTKSADLAWQDAGFAGARYFNRVGVRRCPNPKCRGITLVKVTGSAVVHSYPPATPQIDLGRLPEPIAGTMDEACRCLAVGAFRATALLVRRALEELCADKGAGGPNLMKRIEALGDTIVVPRELLEAADELRLLGNDAAHLEAKSYDAVSREEASLAVELAKELLKSVYQQGELVDRLRALKKATP